MPVYILMKGRRRGGDLGRRENGEFLREDGGGETIIKIYFKKLSSIKNKLNNLFQYIFQYIKK